MKTYGLILAAVISVVLTGCEKELDFDYKEVEPMTVIEGTLTESEAKVSITLSTPMAEPMNTTRLTDATVSISDLTANRTVEMTPDAEGFFIGNITGITGHNYRLTVTRHNETHISDTEMLPRTEIKALEFQWLKMPYDQVAALQVTFTDNSATTSDCYWVRIYRNDKSYMWSIVTDRLAIDGLIDEVLMTSRRDTSEEDEESVLVDGDVVTATVTPISRIMYDYLEALSVSGSNGPALFSGNRCTGYFLAAPVAEASIVFHPASIPDATD